MPINLDNLIQHIVNTRTIKQMSPDDCAHMLGISSQDYINFEQGDSFLSLPELELLANYLGVSVQSMMTEENMPDLTNIYMLRDSVRAQYKSLRHKMICAKIIHQSKAEAINLDELQQLTNIPNEKLIGYQQDAAPIPINHLMEIANALSLPLEGFINHKDTTQIIMDTQKKQQDWHPEIQQDKIAEEQETAYQTLIDAIKTMPIDEQARVAKIVLNVLKNQ